MTVCELIVSLVDLVTDDTSIMDMELICYEPGSRKYDTGEHYIPLDSIKVEEGVVMLVKKPKFRGTCRYDIPSGTIKFDGIVEDPDDE